MASPPKGFLAQKLTGWQTRFKQAFATTPADPLSPADVVLLERVADAIVERDMATPAVLFLETLGPVNFLGSQALHFFTPILNIVLPDKDIRRVAVLLERRDVLPTLASLIEARSQARRR
jgi:hypothetical protein